MKEKELVFDRKKHLLYSKAIKKVIINSIRLHCGNDKVDEIFEKVQLKYVDLLKDLPYLGGKSNTHNGAGGTYDCIAICAYYDVMEPKPTLEELYEMNNEVLLKPFARLGKVFNINNPLLIKLMSKIFKVVSKRDKKYEKDCPTGYIMEVEPYDKELGIRYKFHRCPICEFAKANGYLHLMPAFCNGDYPAMELLHAGLIRQSTCSNGDYCDYQIVGDKSPKLASSPRKISKEGYFYNDK